MASFLNRAKSAAKDFKLRRLDFDNGNRVERDTCEEIMMHQCKTVMVKRSELIAALKKTTWKEHAAAFNNSLPVPAAVLDDVAEITVKSDATDADAAVTDASVEVFKAVDSVVSTANDTLVSVIDAAGGAIAGDADEIDGASGAARLVGEDFLKYDSIFNKLAALMQWDEKKRAKMEKKHAVKEMCFGDLCPSTNVSTNEMMVLLAKNGCFGELIADNYLPERGSKPSFLARLKVAPARISWAQLCQLYNDDFKFCELVMMLDKKFYELQKEAFKEAAKKDKTIKKADDDKLHVKQLQMTKVPVERLFKKILLKKFPQEPADKKHPFWDTEIGAKWALEGAQALTDPTKSFFISWRKVYIGLQEIAPTVKNAIVDNKLYDTEKSRVGPGRSSMSRMDSIEDGGDVEDADDDPTAAHARHARNASSADVHSTNSSHAVISPDELIQLQLQAKTSASQLAAAQQQLAALQQVADEREAMIKSLQTQLASGAVAGSLDGAAAVYTAEHLQQAVAQAHSQSQATIASLQQQVATAMLPSSAGVAAALTDPSQPTYTAEHLQQAVAQAHAQSQASIAHYQSQAQAAQQQMAQLQNAPEIARATASSFLTNMQNAAKASLTMPAPAPAPAPAPTTPSPILGSLFGGLKKNYR